MFEGGERIKTKMVIKFTDFFFSKQFQYASLQNKPLNFKHGSTVDDIESDMDDGRSNDMKPIDDVYNRYPFGRTLPDLPICESKDFILETIKRNPIVILEGATGCGKSTQVRFSKHSMIRQFNRNILYHKVPQFILDDAYEHSKSVNIVVTQPRRIAAVSIANRVCKERDLPIIEDEGHLIGYQVTTRETVVSVTTIFNLSVVVVHK